MTRKHVIIHGHFYQPPRENPWIEVIETQNSATPYHDWNERIYNECYRPNAYSRLLDRHGMIVDIHNNYRSMSFNFGPTLFSWIERHHIGTAGRIIDADKASCRAFDGHGNAIAQVFNHIIMPLATERDQLTQIRWAKQYFRARFLREPEGMWLAETAINMKTVKCLVEEAIRFVVLSPTQAEATRPLDRNAQWLPVDQGLYTRHPYRIYPYDESGNRLPGSLDVFFFNETLSRQASFGDLLNDAHLFGARIDAEFDESDVADQVVTIATDGETFGHHKPFGDMCLAFFFKKIAPKLGIHPVNFGYFLANNPPRYEVRLKNAFSEGTAWSCSHGVGRWVRDCGCRTGGDPSWNQRWRTPLRDGIGKLKERVDAEFEAICSSSAVDPWKLRDAYIRVIDDPSSAVFRELIERIAGNADISASNKRAIRAACEAQKYLLFSFSSCGWFFSDIGGIEAMQNVAYALRALQLGINPADREKVLREFLGDLEQAQSNLQPGKTGKTLAEQRLLPFLDHERIIAFTVAVERAIGGNRADTVRLFHYDTRLRELRGAFGSGRLSNNSFEVSVENDSTGERGRWAVLVSHRECSEVHGWVVAAEAFDGKPSGDIRSEAWTLHPDARLYTLSSIFQTSRESMAEYIHQKISKDTYTKFSEWMRRNEQEIDFLSRLDFPLPPYCASSLAFVYNQRWNHYIGELERRGLEEEVSSRLHELATLIERCKVPIDLKEGAGLLERIIITELSSLSIRLSVETCERIRNLLSIVDSFKIPLSKHTMEDVFYPVITGPLRSLYEEVGSPNGTAGRSPGAERDAADKRALLLAVVKFAQRMNFNTDQFRVDECPQ